MSAKTKAPIPEMRELADQIGEFIQYWGFKKVHGRIWTHVFLSKTPLDAADLMKRLGISKALVSMSLADLMEYDVVEEAGKSDRGTLVYQANPDVMAVILGVIRLRERRMFSRIQAAQKSLSSLPNAEHKAGMLDVERVKSLGALINLGHGALEAFLGKCKFDMSDARKLRFNASAH